MCPYMCHEAKAARLFLPIYVLMTVKALNRILKQISIIKHIRYLKMQYLVVIIIRDTVLNRYTEQ